VSDDCPFEVIAPLGHGGQASTYHARHRDTGEVVALKRFHLARADTWKAHELFERECDVLAALEHPAVPRFIARGQGAGGELWLAMELAPGAPLDARVRAASPVDPDELEDLALQLLGVLDYLHTRAPPVFHRDLKPANIVVQPDGWVTLVDFGSVRTALRPDGGSTVVGTFGYLAPEQLHGEATARTDLFALGMTLAALATGIDAAALPRKGLRLDLDRVLDAAARGPLARLRALISALTEPEADARPSSARAVRAMLARWRVPSLAPRDTPPTSLPAPAPASATPAPYRGRHRRGPLGLVIWLVMALGTFGLDLFERHVLPRRHARRLARAERRARGDPTRRALLVERVEQRLTYERQGLEHAKKRLAHLAGRDPASVRPALPAAPRGQRD